MTFIATNVVGLYPPMRNIVFNLFHVDYDYADKVYQKQPPNKTTPVINVSRFLIIRVQVCNIIYLINVATGNDCCSKYEARPKSLTP